jgi:hypothetical protein
MQSSLKVFVPSIALIFSIFAAAGVANGFADQTVRVSVTSAREAANGTVSSGVLAADGRYVVFASAASNLGTGMHVYRHDRSTHTTEQVDVTPTGTLSTGPGFQPTVSADGRYVAFTSQAADLVATDTNLLQDVFVRDMTKRTDSTSLVSANADGTAGDRVSGLSGLSGAHEISGDGRYVVFLSTATNLMDDAVNAFLQVYVKDTTTGAVVRASVNNATPAELANGNATTPVISGNGHVVAFGAGAPNLGATTSQVYVRDLDSGVTSLETPGAGALASTVPALSFDGRYLVFVTAAQLDRADADGNTDVYLRDRVAGTTVLVSASPNGFSGVPTSAPSISDRGRWVAYQSLDDMLVTGDEGGLIDVFLWDSATNTTTLVSRNDAGEQATGTIRVTASTSPSLSGDGSLVLFLSNAANLGSPVTAVAQFYVRNLASNQAPVVNSGGDQTVDEGTWLKRTGTFTDLDGSTSWRGTADYGTGSVRLIIDPDKKLWLFQVEPFAPGTYTVTISITDDQGATGSATFRHTVRNVEPRIFGLGGDKTIYFGSALHQQVVLVDPGTSLPVPQPAETYSATVSYGDGTVATDLSGVVFMLDHTYARAGTYVVSFTAADSNGGTGSANLTVNVLNYSFEWMDPVGDAFVVGRNLPVKFAVRAPDGSFILDQSVHVVVYDTHGSGFVEYYFGDQPSRSVTASGGSYHVNVDTKDLPPGMYVLRVTFTSPTLTGEFDLATNGTGGASTSTRSRLR